MLNVKDIYPLTGFLRNHKEYVARLRGTGRPELLTVNGRASVVIQDSEAYQRLVDSLDRLEAEEVLRARVEAVKAGERGTPANEVLKDIRSVIDKE